MKPLSLRIPLLILLALVCCTACASPEAAPTDTPTSPQAARPSRTPQGTMILPAISVGETHTPPPETTAANLEDEGTAALAATGVSNASGFVFLGETIPDGTAFDPGETFRKTWTIRNGSAAAWNSDFSLVVIGASPATENLGSPARIPLGAEVPAGGSIEIALDLTAPQQDGRYTVYYQLVDENGAAVPDSQLWVSISVGDVGSSAAAVGAISAELTGSGNQGGEFVVSYCMEMPDARYWYAWEATLTVNGAIYFPTGGSYDPHGLDTPTRCFSISYPLTVESGTPFQISIPKVEIDPVQFQEENCARAQNQLFAAYPGLNFTCSSPGLFYSLISLPAGMTEDRAGQLIMDALSNTIYGPWVLEGVASP